MTTTTINAAGSERLFRTATVLALLIAIAALTLALINRPGRTVATGAALPATQAKSVAPLTPGGSVYNNQVPATPATSMAALAPGGSVYNNQVPGSSAVDGDSPREHVRQVDQ